MSTLKVPMKVFVGIFLLANALNAGADERDARDSERDKEPTHYCGGMCEEYQSWRHLFLGDPHQKFGVSGEGYSQKEAHADMHEECDGRLSEVYCDQK